MQKKIRLGKNAPSKRKNAANRATNTFKPYTKLQASAGIIKGIIELAGNPKLPNTFGWHGGHAEYRDRKMWKQMVMTCLLTLSHRKMERAKIELTRHSSREPDFDNLVRSFKGVVDGFVQVGALQDDKSSCLDAKYLWKKCANSEKHITIRFILYAADCDLDFREAGFW